MIKILVKNPSHYLLFYTADMNSAVYELHQHPVSTCPHVDNFFVSFRPVTGNKLLWRGNLYLRLHIGECVEIALQGKCTGIRLTRHVLYGDGRCFGFPVKIHGSPAPRSLVIAASQVNFSRGFDISVQCRVCGGMYQRPRPAVILDVMPDAEFSIHQEGSLENRIKPAFKMEISVGEQEIVDQWTGYLECYYSLRLAEATVSGTHKSCEAIGKTRGIGIGYRSLVYLKSASKDLN